MEKVKKEDAAVIENPICGIVMPISTIDNCSAEHWKDVLKIITESVGMGGFKPRLVSESDDSGIIQKNIIQNLYEDPIVVVDVSGKNPNVMFELGLRLAFDKPTIVVKDDKTSYSFDTSPIEHLSYPRDLRYQSIIEFKEKLKDKVTATHKKALTDENYTTFLKHFGTFKIAKLDEKVLGKEEYILKSIQDLKEDLLRSINKSRYGGIDFSEEKIVKIIIENRMKDYALDKGISVFDIKEKGWFDECFLFVEKNHEIRRICRSPSVIKNYVKVILDEALPF